ncbi:hypothetical protein K458DRAFT_44107 [Lentithecium fluviatile CBS 122367]|uniref:Uncharacterized protein n=1 Tax=Lentithecium fluviatile CBS 122367 TaxID=1168545 RepID=A0A6G1IYP5_9PLEO|nr:hypothetical protein K458DRAFT_44107 [Lentithecium fluviatile CBS 122367]
MIPESHSVGLSEHAMGLFCPLFPSLAYFLFTMACFSFGKSPACVGQRLPCTFISIVGLEYPGVFVGLQFVNHWLGMVRYSGAGLEGSAFGSVWIDTSG